VFNFFFINLACVQFSKAPNWYFLLITWMQTIELISISNGKPAMAVPFIFVILVSMIKDAIEDIFRAAADSEENNSLVQTFDRSTKEFKDLQWKKLRPGDVVKLRT
jgi:phospholipid-transporting ATPase